MKYSIFILILILASDLYGQSDSIEKAILYNKLISKNISEKEFSNIWSGWNNLIHEIKGYPDLPLDQKGQVHYSFLKKFTDFNKEYLFNRTLEWLSINYGLIPSYLYSNVADGKIIFRNSMDLNTGNTCTYTTIISIKSEKILIESINIGYQTYYEGHYEYDTWIAEKTISVGINQVYPIILKKSSEWKSNLNLLKKTNELFSTEAESLYDYIINYDKYDTF